MAEQFEEGSGHSVGSSLTQEQFIDVLKNLQRKTGTILRNFQDDLTTSFGLFAINASGDPVSRTIQGDTANQTIAVSNGDGVSADPGITLGTPSKCRHHLWTDWEVVNTDTADLTKAKYMHYLQFTTGTPSVNLDKPGLSDTVCEKVMVNTGTVSVTISEKNSSLYQATSVVLDVGDTVTVVSDVSDHWYIKSYHFKSGGAGTINY